MVLRLAGRKADAAIAHHHRGDAVLRGRRDLVGPGDLAVIMGVNVDKARRDQPALRVDFFRAFARDLADFGDAAAADGNVGFKKFAAKPVGNGAAADHEVWIASHVVPSHFFQSCRIIGPGGLKSTGAGETQGCKTLPSDFSRAAFGLSSVASASATVSVMNRAEAPNTQCG